MQVIPAIYKGNLKKADKISYEARNTLRVITKCRSGELGYHKIKCEDCKETTIKANSCRNRHCPICQQQRKEDWIYAKKQKIINSRYYHVVATVPKVLYQIMRQNQEEMYKIEMQTSARAIMKMVKENKKVQIGILQILHTWNQELDYHPHSHMLVTAGGVDGQGNWKELEGNYLVAVKALSKVYRGMFIEELKKIKWKLKFYGKTEKYKEEKEWKKLIEELYNKNFVTYIKEPYENPNTVIDYFGRYVYNVGISESRIKYYDGEEVTYEYKDRKDGNKKKIKTIIGKEFVEKMGMHILPKNFRKIRAYGILTNRGLEKRTKELNEEIKKRKIRKDFRKNVERKNYRVCPKCRSENCTIDYKVKWYELIFIKRE